MAQQPTAKTLKVIILGAGIGGLACAIACLREGLQVHVLEKVDKIEQVGAGIQVPPNGAKVLYSLDLRDKLHKIAVRLDNFGFHRYENGEMLLNRRGGDFMEASFGAGWFSLHRADYHKMLLDEALRLGAKVELGCDAQEFEFSGKPSIRLGNGERIEGDVIVGADGLWSTMREKVLGHERRPEETGNLVYRVTFKLADLKALHDPGVDELITQQNARIWAGPDKHSVMYPVRNGEEFNLVLARPDDLPESTRTAAGDVDEMRETFKGWDPVLTTMLTTVKEVLKWKLCHLNGLETWSRGNAVLIGDACHPVLPYQAEGASIAIEDGFTLAILLGSLSRNQKLSFTTALIPSLLKAFEINRKVRAEMIHSGAVENKTLYHLPDGKQQRERDRHFKEEMQHVWDTGNDEGRGQKEGKGRSPWIYADWEYQMDMMGFNAESAAKGVYETWAAKYENS